MGSIYGIQWALVLPRNGKQAVVPERERSEYPVIHRGLSAGTFVESTPIMENG